MGESRGINHRRNSVDLFIMAIRHDVVKGCAEEDTNATISTRTQENIGPSTIRSLHNRTTKVNLNETTKRHCEKKLSRNNAFTLATRANTHRHSFLRSGLKNVIWWAFVSTFLALIFGQLSTVALAANDVLSKGGLHGEANANNVEALNNNPTFQQEDEEEYPDYTLDDFDSDTEDGEETICFYSESGDDDITCLPELENHDDKRSYLFRSKKAGYLFRSRRAPSYLFRSRRAPSYLFRSKKSDGKQSRSYFFRSRKAPGYLFRSRRSKGYLFRSRREEQTANNMKNDNDPSVATRAGYLFRTRKSFPSEMSDAQDQAKVDLTGNPLTRQLRSRSYLFRS